MRDNLTTQRIKVGRSRARFTILTTTVLATASLTGCNFLASHAPKIAVPRGSTPVFSSPPSVSSSEGSNLGIYTATASDADADPLSFSISGGADASMFDIDAQSGVLSFNFIPNFEAPADGNSDNTYEIDLVVDDGVNGSDTLSLTVQVTNINEAPIFTSGIQATTVENSSFRYIADAFDPDQDNISYSFSPGADEAVFNIDSTSGIVTFTASPDYDAPLDGNGDNSYSITIVADDGNGGVATRGVSITVTDASEFEVDVWFPTAAANLGGVADTFIAGEIRDLEDDLVDNDDVASIEVKGLPAQQSMLEPRLWSAQTTVSAPADQFVVQAFAAAGLGDIASLSLQNDAVIIRPDLLAMDIDDERLLIADSAGLGALVAANLSDNSKTVLFDTPATSGPPIFFPESAELDQLNNQFYVVDSAQRAIILLDAATGDRTMISDDSRGSGPVFSNPLSIALDPANGRALIADAGLEALIAVSLATGDRSVISDATIGVGPPLFFPTATVLDTVNNRALIADPFFEAILAVDLANGNRSLVADAATGTTLDFPIAMSMDSVGLSLLVADLNLLALVSIDLSSGVSVVVSDAATGSGPTFAFPRSMAVDEARNVAYVTDVGLNEILSVDLTNGDRTSYARTTTGAGAPLSGATTVAHDAQSNRVLVGATQGGAGSLSWVDLDNGDRTVLADVASGAGVNLVSVDGLAIDEIANRVLVVDAGLNALLAVDLTNGDRSILSDAANGSGLLIPEPVSLALDMAGNRALVIERGLSAVVSIDLATGDRSLLSGSGIGVGPQFAAPEAIAYDDLRARVIVVDSGVGALIAVDLASGDRSILSDAATGTGPLIGAPRTVDVDAENDRAVIVSGALPVTVYSVDLASGDRSVLSDFATAGPDVVNVPAVSGDYSRDRLFAIDSEMQSLLVIDEVTGQKAIVSR